MIFAASSSAISGNLSAASFALRITRSLQPGLLDKRIESRSALSK